MAVKRNDLLADMARFERRLRDAWSLDVPSVPQHLKAYHQDWKNTLQQPLVEATEEEMIRAMRQADLVLVSDFHPLRRSRTGLAHLLARLADNRPLVLGLELLSHGTTLTVGEALRDKSTTLVTGHTLQQAYAPVLEALRGHRATLVGTWVDGSVQRRDAAAVEVWERIQRKRGHFRGVFHFGDWHLGAAHLPARLRAMGEQPVVIHQSPEPVWERVGLFPPGHVYRLAENHWAWLQTPPLGLCANHLQDLGSRDAESVAEATEHLCESASEHLARMLEVSLPACRLTVAPPDSWADFHRHLPRSLAAALPLDLPPRVPIFHPRLPLLWSPGPLDLAHLIEGAAHCLNCSGALQMEVGRLPELRRQVFRHLCAHLVNPFLATSDLASLAQQLLAPAARPAAVRQVTKLQRDPQAWLQLEPATEVLLLRHTSQAVACAMVGRPDLDKKDLRQFLDPGQEAFDWDDLMATIQAA